ncbi:class I SAM-dependent methyltransferase [Phenylobacterium soli]|uniref:Uncharacterized protein n=1 Tax=Phenylobacterium soli TaxID=2170551 RepID=A0A328AME1_9CAUL|nr:methyltransferase [Phenylobacterium soli]RAK54594.1 hypothetical protein DJ017_08685 [Phenylobacterium soli]
MSLDLQAYNYLKETVGGWTAPPPLAHLNGVLRVLTRWRQLRLVQTYQQRHGTIIWAGPFKGMDYIGNSAEGALMPRLLGSYESELHPHLRALADEGLDCVVDVGCAEGYYAVGLARMLPTITVHAHDIDAKAQAACRALAAKNGVADRVMVGGEFKPEDFNAFAGRRALVIVDAEGAEMDILRPDLGPGLAQLKILVETHDISRPGALAAMVERFSPTHDIIRVDQQYLPFEPPPWFQGLPHLDRLIALWEWRVTATPWLVMRPKAGWPARA